MTSKLNFHRIICACGCGKVASVNPKYAKTRFVRGHRPAPPTRIWDKSIVLLSPEDEDLRERRWTMSPDGYVIIDGPLHRLVGTRMKGAALVGSARGETVDHINENKMDNRRENLRIVSLAENKQNATRPLKYKKSGLPRGIFPTNRRDGSGFQVMVSRKRDGVKKMLYLGVYETLEEAQHVYDQYKREHTAYVPIEERLLTKGGR